MYASMDQTGSKIPPNATLVFQVKDTLYIECDYS